MKYLIILLLFPIFLTAQVNFSTYGATNNGTTDDDTAELQAALDAESNLIADANATFFISGKLDIDTRVGQTINWNGATIITNSRLNPAINIDKKTVNGGATTMSNLTLDGNDLVVRGIYMESRVVFNNIIVKDLNQGSQGTSSPAGIYARVKNDADSFGAWEFNNVSILNLVGTSNGSISNCVIASNTDGSVNGVLWYWDIAPTTQTTVTWNNLTVDGMWGDDGGGVFINDNVGMKNTTSGHIFNGGIIKNCERRALKGFSSNMTFNNVTFEDVVPANPNIQCGTISGLVVFGSSQRANVDFDGCTFVGHGYDGRIIPIAVEDWSIKNSTFTGGAYVTMTNLNGTNVINGLIECNDFGTQGYIGSYGTTGTWSNGTIGIGGNTWGGGAADIRLSGSEYYVTTPNCGAVEVKPTITLNGSSTISLTAGNAYTELSATVSDPQSGDITSNLVITGTVNTAVAGTYLKYYNASDAQGNAADEKVRTIIVSSSGTAPIVTNVSITDITTTSARIEWTINQGVTGRIDYGLTTSYGSSTPSEASFLTFHSQVINGLTPNTTYNFNIAGQNSSAESIVLLNRTFTTLGAPIILSGKSKKAFFKLIN
jgi:hypothetical protein